MWCSTYHQKLHDMYYPSRIVLPANISKLIPLSIKQTWVHYPNLCAIGIRYQTFFKGWHQWKPTQLINNIPLWHLWQHSDSILNSYYSCSPCDHLSPLNQHSDAILKSYHSCSLYDHRSPWNHACVLFLQAFTFACDKSLPLCNQWQRYLSIQGYSP